MKDNINENENLPPPKFYFVFWMCNCKQFLKFFGSDTFDDFYMCL